MAIEIRNPCDEDWDAMPRRGEGRYCGKCERTVVDLSHLTRAQAEARVAAAKGRICLAIKKDAATHEPVFRSEPARAPAAVGFVLATALVGGGCSGEADVPAEARAELVEEPVDGGPPMEPIDPSALVATADAPCTRAIPVEELELPEDSPVPTAEQRRLTERKRRPSCPVPTASMPQSTYMTLGF